MLAVAGDVAGDSSLLRLRFGFGTGGAAMGSMPPEFRFRCERCFSSMVSRPSLVKGFGRTSFMPVTCKYQAAVSHSPTVRTVLEIHRNVVAADIGCHCNDRRVVELSNQMCSGDAIKIRHDDIHKNKIVSRAIVHLVDSFQAVELCLLVHYLAEGDTSLTALSIEQ